MNLGSSKVIFYSKFITISIPLYSSKQITLQFVFRESQ